MTGGFLLTRGSFNLDSYQMPKQSCISYKRLYYDNNSNYNRQLSSQNMAIETLSV